MSRTTHPFQAPDISALAKTIRQALDSREGTPGHVELLNILSKAAGFRNYQHLKASHDAEARLSLPAEPVANVDHRRVEAASRCFDDDGVLLRWPAKTSQQQLCLWLLWSKFPAERDLSEPEVNAILKAYHRFGDHVLLRREMFNQHLLFRTPDCRLYRRIERRPPPDALALIRLRSRAGAGDHEQA